MVPFVMYHHERIDEKGYPEGLRGEQIPLYARILHVADSFDAMTAYRPYREAPGKEYAFAEFKRLKGTQFDGDIVEAAFRVL
jgi:HD-GYP domain-containing protein (c-di-GMP phosphodiesterase class II)